MIPLYLKLLNFMSHADTEIDFTKIDVACIQGPNGSGKSSIADGILYALSEQTSRGKSDDIVRIGSVEMTDIFHFIQTDIYKIIRKKSLSGRGKNIVELYQYSGDIDSWNPHAVTGWTPLATGDAARAMILNILHRDYKTLTSSSFLLQGQGEKLITAGPTERYKVVFDIFGLENYAERKKRVTSLKNKGEGQLEALQEYLPDLQVQVNSIPEIEVMIQDKKGALHTASEQVLEKEKLLLAATSDLAVAESKIKTSEELGERIRAARKEQQRLIAERERISASNKPVASRLEAAVITLYSEMSIDEEGMQKAMNLLAESKVKADGLVGVENDLATLSSKIKAIDKTIEDNTQHIEKYRKILNNKDKIFALIEEEKAGVENLRLMREKHDQSIAALNSMNKTLQKAAEMETSIAKLQTIISSAEKDREHEIKTLHNKISEAEKKAAYLGEVVCKGEGQFAGCIAITDAVKAKDQVGAFQEESKILQKPLAIPEQVKIEESRKELLALGVTSIKETIKVATLELAKLKENIQALNKRLQLISTWTRQAPEIEIAEVEIVRTSKTVEAIRAEKVEHEQNIKTLTLQRAEIDNIANTILVIQAVIDRMRIASDVKGLQSKIDEISLNTDELEKNYTAEQTELMKERDSLRIQIASIRILVETLKNNEKAIITDITKLEASIITCNRAAEKLKTSEAEIAKLQRQHKIWEILENAYEKIPFQILDNVIPIMEQEANRVLSEISTTGMRLEFHTEKTNKTNKNVKDALHIIISDIAGERPIEMYSGGEKTRQILAIAVGLAELSARKAGVKIGMLLIDEPAGLDRQGLLDFGQCFIKLVESKIFKKGLLVAHEEMLKDIFDQKIIVKKEGSVSQVEVFI